MTLKKINVIDLFCGCGGFSKGFLMAGFNIVLGIDVWEDAIRTYNHNFPGVKTMTTDISKVRVKDILKKIDMEKEEIDVIIGGPPCQGFSLSGKRLIDDSRNKLYKSFVEMVAHIKPKVFVMENVPGMMRLFGGKVKDAVIRDFSDIGYHVNMELLTADEFGVPQHRKRIFFVGINMETMKNTRYFEFPIPTHGVGKKPFITCKDAISDLDFISDEKPLPQHAEYKFPAQNDYQAFMRENSNILLNHSVTVHKEKTKQIIAMVPDGGNYKNLPKELWSTRKVNIGHNHHFHYYANRVPTVRESARIQSFQDNFEFLGIKTSQLKQVGNAVPPLLVKAIAEKVKEVIVKG